MKKSSHPLATILFTIIILLVLVIISGKFFPHEGGESIFGRLLRGGATSLSGPPTPTPVYLIRSTIPITPKPAVTPKPRR